MKGGLGRHAIVFIAITLLLDTIGEAHYLAQQIRS